MNLFTQLRQLLSVTPAPKVFLSVTDLDGRTVDVLETSLSKWHLEQAEELARRQHDKEAADNRAEEAETNARAEAARITAGTQRKDH